MGNTDPANDFCIDTPEQMKADGRELIEKCSFSANFIPSSYYDVSPIVKWEYVDTFY